MNFCTSIELTRCQSAAKACHVEIRHVHWCTQTRLKSHGVQITTQDFVALDLVVHCNTCLSTLLHRLQHFILLTILQKSGLTIERQHKSHFERRRARTFKQTVGVRIFIRAHLNIRAESVCLGIPIVDA